MNKNQDKPENHGKPWEEKDQKELKKLYDDGETLLDLAKKYKRTKTSIELTIRKLEILNIIEERNIEKFIHFTDIRNMPTIEKYGILSIPRLKHQQIPFHGNDKLRLDDEENGISVSITSRNTHLLKSYEEKESRTWAEIEIDPTIAASGHCLFFDSNAASRHTKYKNKSEKDLQSTEAFMGIFAEEVTNSSGQTFTRKYKKTNEPTDDQAEIIVKFIIPKSKILNWKKINV